MKVKLVGRVFNDRWLVYAYKDEKYHLINTYNHQKMVLSFHTLIRIYRKEIDIDKMIAESKETYYEVLQESSYNWHEESNNYAPFVHYMLGLVDGAYREFNFKADLLINRGFTKPERIREIIKSTPGKITKTEIMARCPDISQVTVQRTLNDLLKSNEIIKLGGGRYTSYVWNEEKE